MPTSTKGAPYKIINNHNQQSKKIIPLLTQGNLLPLKKNGA